MKILIHTTMIVPVQAVEVEVFDDGTFRILNMQVGAVTTNTFLMEQMAPGHKPRPDLQEAISACVYAEVLNQVSEKADAKAQTLSPEFATSQFGKRASDEGDESPEYYERLEAELEKLESENEDIRQAAHEVNLVTKKVIN